jgi:hypothetical protein
MSMIAVKTEETLHDYLRRHFERISESQARQLAEQGEGLKKSVVPGSSDATSHRT